MRIGLACILVVSSLASAEASEPQHPRRGGATQGSAAKIDTVIDPLMKTTQRKTWSKWGWRMLRWGMGPGDVIDATKSLRGEIIPGPKYGHEQRFTAPLNEPIFGTALDVAFAFYEDRLVQVDLTPRDRSSEAQQAWFALMRDALGRKYGKSSCSNRLASLCTWESGGNLILVSVLRANPRARTGLTATTVYGDLEHFQRLIRQSEEQMNAEFEKL